MTQKPDKNDPPVMLALDVLDQALDHWAVLPRVHQEEIKSHIGYFAGRIARFTNGLDKAPGGKTA
jgi:hypothetical protein